MIDSISINEVRVKKKEVDQLKVSVIKIPKLSIGHSESVRIRLFTQCGLSSIYYRNNFYCIKTVTGEEVKKAKDLLSEIFKDLEIDVEACRFYELESNLRELLLIELFRHAAAYGGYFALQRRTFIRPDERQDGLIIPAFELGIRDSEDSYCYSINSTYVSLVNCNKVFEGLNPGDELLKLCSRRFECRIYLENGKCKYSFPSYAGLLKEKIGEGNPELENELENIKEKYGECPEIEENDFQIIYVKRTKDSKHDLAYPSFILHKETTGSQIRQMGIKEELRNKLLARSSVRFLNIKKITKNIFQNEMLRVKDLQLPVSIELNKAVELSTGKELSEPVRYEEPRLRFDPILDESSVEPSSLFYKGVYDAQSTTRPFKRIQSYVVMRKSKDVKGKVNQLLSYLSDCKKDWKDKVEFAGLNHRFSKFNCKYVPPKDEDFLEVGSEEEFIEAGNSIVNRWNNDPERVVILILPEVVDEDTEDFIDERYGGYAQPYSLYYKLKKIFVEAGLPCQMIDQKTLDRIDKFILQNLLVNIYSKMGGKPWSLINPVGDVNTFIGIGFGLNTEKQKKNIYVGVSNIFDSHGEWLDIYSQNKYITDEDWESFHAQDVFTKESNSYKLTLEMSRQIVEESLQIFKDTNPKIGYPRNIVIHKNGEIHECELLGFAEAIKNVNQKGGKIEKVGILSIIKNHNLRLFGNETEFSKAKIDRPPLRGAVYPLSPTEALLCTTGKFIGERPEGNKIMYSGIGTPRPLLLRKYEITTKEKSGKHCKLPFQRTSRTSIRPQQTALGIIKNRHSPTSNIPLFTKSCKHHIKKWH